jgi:hypothetical protein
MCKPVKQVRVIITKTGREILFASFEKMGIGMNGVSPGDYLWEYVGEEVEELEKKESPWYEDKMFN